MTEVREHIAAVVKIAPKGMKSLVTPNITKQLVYITSHGKAPCLVAAAVQNVMNHTVTRMFGTTATEGVQSLTIASVNR